jgi:hypothetical protein
MNQAQLAARSKGGQARANKYPYEQRVEWAQLGGRPRRQLIRLQSAPEAKIFNFKEEKLDSTNMKTLQGLVKKLYPEMFQPSPG